jgi:TonB family protein
MYDNDYDSDGAYAYKERRFKWLGYVIAFVGGVVIGALVFGRGCPGGPDEEPKAETVAVAETAAEVPEEPTPPPEPETAETAATAEEAIVFEEPEVETKPRVEPARLPTPPKTTTEKPREVTPRPASGKGLTPDQIYGTINKRLSGVQYEYTNALKKNPNLPGGKISVRFTIGPDGRVTAAEVVDDTVGNAELRSGVLSRVRTWKFQRSGGETTVVYPFVFVSAGR